RVAGRPDAGAQHDRHRRRHAVPLAGDRRRCQGQCLHRLGREWQRRPGRRDLVLVLDDRRPDLGRTDPSRSRRPHGHLAMDRAWRRPAEAASAASPSPARPAPTGGGPRFAGTVAAMPGRRAAWIARAIVVLAALALAHDLTFLARYGSVYGEALAHAGHGQLWA